MTFDLAYFVLSALAFVFGLVTLVMVSNIREYERFYNKPGVNIYLLAMMVATLVALLYTFIYGSIVLPGLFGHIVPTAEAGSIFQNVIDYGLYFIVAVLFLISAYFLRKK